MLDELFKPHPNSLALCSGRQPGRGGFHWLPLVNLIWLFWLVSSFWLLPLGLSARLSTGVSLAVFLVLYHRALFGDRVHALWNVLAIAVLGLVMMPANGAAWTYLIYASALLPLCASLPLTLWLQAALTATFVFDAEVLAGFPTLLATASGVVVCNAVFATNLFFSYERRRQAELRLSHDEVRRLAATAERERIGRDLHDLLGHTLSLIAIKSELARRLLDRDTAAARRELAEIERVARGSLAEVRGAVTGMRAALLASELASAKLMLETAGIRFAHRIQAVSMPADVEAALAFGLREAVTNVQRHAVAATRVEVDLEQQDGAVLLTIRDDGRGGVHAKGNGLSGMQERLEALGGRLEIDSPPRAGTELRLRVPLPHAARVELPPTPARAA